MRCNTIRTNLPHAVLECLHMEGEGHHRVNIRWNYHQVSKSSTTYISHKRSQCRFTTMRRENWHLQHSTFQNHVDKHHIPKFQTARTIDLEIQLETHWTLCSYVTSQHKPPVHGWIHPSSNAPHRRAAHRASGYSGAPGHSGAA